ncbi:putative dolichyl pyrophosphate Man9GlcNAc2 alpha-1,3-glucosyltransferase [Pseudolycoriella hygida]|uniref:dolichyl-P-Glc:Man9GlcNAc2-PP-dolichol alpha-1,3-glucosyltransferase n=1 Tax=Pseudolycoriella hygida TaxID=35572 RepID=A0A9Q0NGG5_9DIPT|nr:putative dolichyl pyrophosphate Man9GlcNAc2 alpha-1,3-glucosyltransferase [Pseudolycoriella hygida]
MYAKIVLAVSIGMLIRSIISLHPYSGQNTPPMYGDFEAQRHWQEVVVNLPISDWYRNTSDNDLMYWGLDYPPLSAYHSFIVGQVAKFINPKFVTLHESRGLTDDSHKHFMRTSVLVADLLLYIPAMLICCQLISQKNWFKIDERLSTLYTAVAVLYPGQILIDNGHFQYNNISLGLAAAAIIFLLRNQNVISAIFFTLSLNYKQMELYHALPFFVYLLATCFKESSRKLVFIDGLLRLIKIGGVVILTFIVLWFPWFESIKDVLQVLHRIFPLARGVFEDKVSNVWCIVNVVIPLRDNFPNERMAVICLTCTLGSILPSLIHLFRNSNPKTFLLSLINSSLAFFLFSFQVHEKSILLATLPVMLYFPMDPLLCLWFLQIATFSMIPLLVRDKLLLAFIALNAFYLLLIKLLTELPTKRKEKTLESKLDIFKLSRIQPIHSKSSFFDNCKLWGFYLSLCGQIILLISLTFVPPPQHLPHIFPLLISAFSCEVVDESDGCGGKFSTIIVSEQFTGKSLLQRHRLVNAALSEELKTIHAFSQKTFTPEQWAQR